MWCPTTCLQAVGAWRTLYGALWALPRLGRPATGAAILRPARARLLLYNFIVAMEQSTQRNKWDYRMYSTYGGGMRAYGPSEF